MKAIYTLLKDFGNEKEKVGLWYAIKDKSLTCLFFWGSQFDEKERVFFDTFVCDNIFDKIWDNRPFWDSHFFLLFFFHRKSPWIKNLFCTPLQTVAYIYRAPESNFECYKRWGLSSGERVPLAPLGWY